MKEKVSEIFTDRWAIAAIKYAAGPLLFAAVTWGAVRTELGDLKAQSGMAIGRLDDHETRLSRVEGKLDQIVELNKEILRRLK